MTDYMKIDESNKTRPICGAYEYGAAITPLAKAIYESKTLSDYVANNGEINDFLNPCQVALNCITEGSYDVLLNRNGDIVKLSDLYVNPAYTELLQNYFKQQQERIKDLIIDPISK